MTSLRARYQPGSWVSISVPRRWLLVEIEPQHPSVQRLWEALSGGEVIEDVLDILIAAGVRATPSFMLLWLEETPRGVLRGAGAIEFSTAGSTSTHSAEGHLLWDEIAVAAGTTEFILRVPDAGAGIELPMASGVTMASQVVVSVVSAAEPIVNLPQSPGSTGLPPAQVEAQGTGDEAGEPAEPDDAPLAAAVHAPLAAAVPPAAAVDAPLAAAVPLASADGPPAEADPSYDYLFGATVRPVPVEEVLSEAVGVLQQATEQAPKEAPREEAPAFGATAGWHTVAPPGGADSPVGSGTTATSPETVPSKVPPPALAKPSDTQPSRVASGGLIDGVPWLSAGPAEREAAIETRPEASPAPVASPASPPPTQASRPRGLAGGNGAAATPEPADAERTVNRAALLASAAQGASGPTVLAGRCPAGHLTAPHSAACRVCQASIPVQQPFEIARPPLGVLRLSTGDTVTLDRGVLIGRKPAGPVDSAERPHLVRVNSPEHDVSRQHAEIVLEGWHVYVRDLGSTNGTTVTLPGQPSQRLREGELQLLEHGTVIVLADEIQCVFEVTS